MHNKQTTTTIQEPSSWTPWIDEGWLYRHDRHEKECRQAHRRPERGLPYVGDSASTKDCWRIPNAWPVLVRRGERRLGFHLEEINYVILFMRFKASYYRVCFMIGRAVSPARQRFPSAIRWRDNVWDQRGLKHEDVEKCSWERSHGKFSGIESNVWRWCRGETWSPKSQSMPRPLEENQDVLLVIGFRLSRNVLSHMHISKLQHLAKCCCFVLISLVINNQIGQNSRNTTWRPWLWSSGCRNWKSWKMRCGFCNLICL